MGTASRGDLLAAAGKRRFDTMELPVCGLTVRFRNLSELELSDLEMEALQEVEGSLQQDPEAVRHSRARLIIRCLVDDAGQPLLNPGDTDAVEALDAMDSALLYDRLREFVGIGRRVRDIQAAQEAAKKNSNSTSGDDSPAG